PVLRGSGVVCDTERADVVAEDAAELVGRDAPDEASSRAEGGKTGNGIGDRSARAFGRGPHRGVEADRLLGIDQAHRALGEVVLAQEPFVAARDDVDDGVADADHVGSLLRHAARRPALRFAVPGVARYAHYIPSPERNTSCSAPQVKPSETCSRRPSGRCCSNAWASPSRSWPFSSSASSGPSAISWNGPTGSRNRSNGSADLRSSSARSSLSRRSPR